MVLYQGQFKIYFGLLLGQNKTFEKGSKENEQKK